MARTDLEERMWDFIDEHWKVADADDDELDFSEFLDEFVLLAMTRGTWAAIRIQFRRYLIEPAKVWARSRTRTAALAVLYTAAYAILLYWFLNIPTVDALGLRTGTRPMWEAAGLAGIALIAMIAAREATAYAIEKGKEHRHE